jgi:two-component system chemotaxis sensor kinase CheA
LREDLRAKLLVTFQAEHTEHLEAIRAFLAKAREGTAVPGELDEAFRHAHSLKGAARAVDLSAVRSLAHGLETLLSRVREKKLALDKPALKAAAAALDASEDMVASLFQNRPAADQGAALAAIEGFLGVAGSAAPASVPVAGADERPGPAPTPESLRVSAESLDRLLKSSDQLLAESLRQDRVKGELSDLSRQLSELEKEWGLTRRAAASSLQDLARDPENARIVRYLDYAEHAVQALSRQTRAALLLQQRGAGALRNHAQELQEDVRQARMVSAESVFSDFRKMTRDLAREEGKEVELKLTGLGVSVDREVLQALKDPVMHMLRNALSHGIEKPEQRKAAGKSPEGAISLTLEASGSRLILTLDDDGRGLDLPRIRELAQKRGLLPPGAPDENLRRVIFAAGFSTSRAITELSGRGMGLSVVSEAVRRLQGELSVPAKPGPGMRIVLSVPLTVSTHRLLLVTCGGQTFGLPALAVERMLRVRVCDVASVEGKPAIIIDGQAVALKSLAHILGLEKAAGTPIPVVVLRSGPQRAAVSVDALFSEREAVIKPLTGPAGRIALVSGAILMEDGALALVLQVDKLLEAFQRQAAASFEKEGVQAEAKKVPSILVVDDSITTRTLEKSILEAHGYSVSVAIDGVEAMNRLRAAAFDLVIADIQMPRMDGFELLREMKKDARFSKIPVIMVTSLESRQDQEQGLSLGADAYIVKREFDQQEILNTIRQLL